jgi:hypothetical protein
MVWAKGQCGNPKEKTTYVLPIEKQCLKCGSVKPIAAFRVSKRGYAYPYCRPCDRNRTAQWKRDNPRRAAAIDARKRERYADYYLWQNARARARKAGIPFTITLDYVKELIADTDGICPILGIPMEHAIGNGKWRSSSPSLDRFDPKSGYVSGNVYVVSWRANFLKSDATPEELQALIGWMQRTLEAKELDAKTEKFEQDMEDDPPPLMSWVDC